MLGKKKKRPLTNDKKATEQFDNYSNEKRSCNSCLAHGLFSHLQSLNIFVRQGCRIKIKRSDIYNHFSTERSYFK